MEYGLIGEKLTHSFSKEIHAQLFDYKYELCEIPKDRLDAFMRARDFKAINVTIPYKQAVIPYLDEISDAARDIGAVNTIVNRGGKLYGDNTDFLGLSALIKRTGVELSGKKVYILGSGGTSKTAAAVVKSLGAAEVNRVSRSGRDGCITYEAAQGEDIEVIINTTPCGMYPKIGYTPIDITPFKNLCGVIDAVYNPLSSALVCAAKAYGIPAAGGLYMLVAQAAFAAEKFTGESVAPEKIEKIYRKMLISKRNIVLIGMPASGKTTVGTILSKNLGMPLIDTDSEICKFTGRAIPEIFAESGEAGFRDIEAQIIKEVSARQGVIISTGGGAILRRENTELLRENGRIYFLDRPLELLITTDDRPLSSNRADLEKRYNERYDIYCDSADIKIDGAATPEICADRIKEDFFNEDTCN